MSAIVQAMGDNVAELIVHFGAELSNGSDIVEKDDKLIFFDVLGLFMVRPQSVSSYCRRTSHPAWQISQWQMPMKELCPFVTWMCSCSTGNVPHEDSQSPPQNSTSACFVDAVR